ncbi:uncharacterized protein [Nicotiana tomentosiformis]|uniref:Uncharacterized protein isoform X1 n=1 Tax=Nicotiana tabacum TaxID=4097 RepID=A0A1S4B6Q3_TOBAC|nr:uncharacterized protein LOC104113316 [Nicotiana tomentosiformis]XP_016484526.1 PREDICTED: uncharacterized protein LOC107805062 isoform X1 [Nicotiana tabacum]XP_016484527.1 PREDICTED: uncharacterized protein LOC107805062 isoform X2 [Nicotiana tabacum]
MLRILSKNHTTPKTTTMVTRSESKIETYDVIEDLSSWEFVNPSDDEQEDSYSFSDQTDDDESDELMSKEDNPCEIGSPSSPSHVQITGPLLVDPCEIGSPYSPSHVETTGPLLVFDVRVDDGHEEEEEEEEEEEDYDGYDLDDELVPKWLSDKFGRQRIRKLGKRACSRMNKSKRGPYIFNRPGCVHGKHGLGVQHSYV